MALIKCPECGKEISDRAAACIHCGCPLTSGRPNVPNQAQIRVMCKTATLKINGCSASHGNIVNISTTTAKTIEIVGYGGDVGIGNRIHEVVRAGHKYDLSTHRTMVGKCFYLKEVSSFV